MLFVERCNRRKRTNKIDIWQNVDTKSKIKSRGLDATQCKKDIHYPRQITDTLFIVREQISKMFYHAKQSSKGVYIKKKVRREETPNK